MGLSSSNIFSRSRLLQVGKLSYSSNICTTFLVPQIARLRHQGDYNIILLLDSSVKKNNFTYTIPGTILGGGGWFFFFLTDLFIIKWRQWEKATHSRGNNFYTVSVVHTAFEGNLGAAPSPDLQLPWKSWGGNRQAVWKRAKCHCFSWRENTLLCFQNVKYNIQRDDLQLLLSFILYQNLNISYI